MTSAQLAQRAVTCTAPVQGLADMRANTTLFPCHSTVTIYVPPVEGNQVTRDEIVGAARSAANSWNRLTTGSVPRLSVTEQTTAPSSGIPVAVIAHGGPPYCDRSTLGSGNDKVELYNAAHANCVGSNVADSPRAILIHAFGHALGFNSGTAHKRSGVPSGVNSSCASELPPDKTTVNGSPCQHEAERLNALYGAVPKSAVENPGFWSTPIITDYEFLPRPPMQVVLDSHILVQAVAYGHRRQSYGGIPGQTSVTSPTAFRWDTWFSDEITVRGDTIFGAQMAPAGDSTLAAVRINAVPSTMLLAGVKQNDPDSLFRVDVVQPPPPTGHFHIDTLIVPPSPIQRTGDYTAQAHILNPFDSYFQTRWVITYSDRNQVITTNWVTQLHPSYTFNVRAGSYTITVRVETREYTDSGGLQWTTQTRSEYLTVCTGTSGTNGGISPQRVGGCGDDDDDPL